jgi:hypothetical protein
MKHRTWIAAGLVLIVGLAAGCSNNSSTSAPKAGTSGTPPKGGETKTNVGKGGLENPPPP